MSAVELTWAEYVSAVHRGLIHFAVSQSHNRKATIKRSDRWDVWLADSILGAVGELAFCKLVDRHWGATVDGFRSVADVGTRTEVRTRRNPAHDLIVRDDDNPDQLFVLVTGEPPRMTVVGWIEGAEVVNRPDWRQNYGGQGEAWFVPQSALTPFVRVAS